MTTRAYIIGDSNVMLWGISSRERLSRQIGSIDDLALVETEEALTGSSKVVLLRADFLFELRTISSLMTREGILTHEGTPAAAHVAQGDLPAALALLKGRRQRKGRASSVLKPPTSRSSRRVCAGPIPRRCCPCAKITARHCRTSFMGAPTRASRIW